MSSIEAESPRRGISKSAVVRERLEAASLNAIADLIGSVDGLPADLSARKKAYLRFAGKKRVLSR